MKRILSILLCIATCISMFPATAFAQNKAAAADELIEEIPTDSEVIDSSGEDSAQKQDSENAETFVEDVSLGTTGEPDVEISDNSFHETPFEPAEEVITEEPLSDEIISDTSNVLSAVASGTDGNITWSLESTGVLTLSGSGVMKDYSSSYNSSAGGNVTSAPWGKYVASVTSVIINSGVTSIGEWAFGHCSSLTSVEIPSGVTSIGDYAFGYCSSLTSVEIPSSVTSIGDAAFRECSSMIEICVDSKNVNYSSYDNCLYNKNQSTLIQCPSGKSSIEFSPNVTSIGDYAFCGCSSLTSVEIPTSVTSIGECAFAYCSSLTSVEIPSSVTSIWSWAFGRCTSLTSVHITDIAAWCKISFLDRQSNPLYKAHNLYLKGEKVIELVVPEGVTSIGDYAFCGCSSLTSVSIPSSVTSIGDYAFYDCSSLTSVSIPEGVTIIGDRAFYDCSSLTSVEIPASVTSIGDYAFYDCSSLTSVSIPEGVTSIGDYAFCGCSSLIEIRVDSKNVNYSSYDNCLYNKNQSVLMQCPSRKSNIEFSPNVTSIGACAFYDCSSLTSVEIPSSVTSIGSSAFWNCSSLMSMEIPSGVTSIGACSFDRCTGLMSVSIPEGVTSIGNYTFYGCRSLTSVEIPSSVTSIGDYAFSGCSSLTDVYYSGTQEEWNSITIAGGNSSLTNATIHYEWNGIIPTKQSTGLLYTLEDGKAVITGAKESSWRVIIPDMVEGYTVSGISDEAFKDDINLLQVYISSSVSNVGENAFSGCSALSTVCFAHKASDVLTIGENAFAECNVIRVQVYEEENIHAAICNVDWGTSRDSLYSSTGMFSFQFDDESGLYYAAICPAGSVEEHAAVIGCTAVLPETFELPSELGGYEVTELKSNAIYNSETLERLLLPDTIATIAQYAVYGCSHLQNIVFYGGVPSLPRNKSEAFEGSGEELVLWYASEKYNSEWEKAAGASELIGDIPCYEKNEGSYLYYPLQPNNERTKLTIDYTDDYFLTAGTQFDYDLAVQSLEFVMSSTSNAKDKAGDKASSLDAYIRRTYETFGFENDYYEYRFNEQKTMEDDCAYALAWKTLSDGTPLVVMMIRSSGYESEWYSNAHVTDAESNANSLGFYRAAYNAVYGHTSTIDGKTYEGIGLIEYMKQNGLSLAKTKIWVSGFSRGGAIANNIGALLNRNSSIAEENLYIYTFATPRTVLKSVAVDYSNIHNIVNEMDIVPQVPLQSWGYTRHGTTYSTICKTLNPSGYTNRLKTMSQNFSALTGTNYKVENGQEQLVDNLTETLTSAIASRMDYSGDVQQFVMNLAYNCLAGGDLDLNVEAIIKYAFEDYADAANYVIKVLQECGDYDAFDWADAVITLRIYQTSINPLSNRPADKVVRMVLQKLINISSGSKLAANVQISLNDDLIAYISDMYNSGAASSALMQHWPEAYLCWLKSGNESNTLIANTPGKSAYKRYCGKCPVDIFVYDSADNLVASIVDDCKVNEGLGENALLAYVDVYGEKTIIIPNDGTYRVVTIAREGDADMDITISECETDGGIIQKTVYTDIPLTEGQEFSATLSPDSSSDVVETGELSLEPTAVVDGEAERAEVQVQYSEGGAAYGGGSYSIGDSVHLGCSTEDGYVFVGWYDAKGNRLSSSENYGFTALENVTLTAVFASDDVTMTMDREYIALQAGADPAVVQCRVLPGEWAQFMTWSAENPEGREVIAVSESGEVTAIAVGTAYAVATIEYGDYCFTARCRVDVTEDTVKEELIVTGATLESDGVELGTDGVTCELFRTEHATFDVLLQLMQNMPLLGADPESADTAYTTSTDNGVSVAAARFEDESADAAFSLRVLDDRTLEIVPREESISNPDSVKKTYNSKIVVTVDGQEFTTGTALKLTVKKSLPKLKAKAVTLNAWYPDCRVLPEISGATVMTVEAVTLPEWLRLDMAQFAYNGTPAQKTVSGNAVLKVRLVEWSIPANVTVKVTSVYKAPSLRLSASTLTLNPDLVDSGRVSVTVSPADYPAADLTIRVLDSKKQEVPDRLNVQLEDGCLQVSCTETTEYGVSYKVCARDETSGKEVSLTVKTLKQGAKPTLSGLKVTGSPDLTWPEKTVPVTVTVKNCCSGSTTLESWNVLNGKKADVSDAFTLEARGNGYLLGMGKERPAVGSYKLQMNLTLADGSAASRTVSFTVKRTAVTLKASKTSVSLNRSILETAQIGLTCTTKGYALENPILTVMDKTGKNPAADMLDVSYRDGVLSISANENTAYGTTYKVTVQPEAYQKVLTVTVNVPTETKSAIIASLKASGKIDVLRSAAAITLTPSYKNYLGVTAAEKTLTVWAGSDGKTYPQEVTEQFEITEQGTGYTIRIREGQTPDPALKYAAKLELDFGDGITVSTSLAKLTVSKGKATFTGTAETLYLSDVNSRGEITLSTKDASLNAVCRAELASGKAENCFTLRRYRDGTLTLGFGEGAAAVLKGKKSVKVKLNLWLYDNTSEKPDATVTVTVPLHK